MKKKLFAVVMVVSFYALFISVFTAADSKGQISHFFAEVGLSDSPAVTTSSSLTGISGSDINLKAGLRRPMPKPRRPKRPKPKPRGPRVFQN